jgi:putative toxin-antitoxin system antitoxin component (TIGR02293 family)
MAKSTTGAKAARKSNKNIAEPIMVYKKSVTRSKQTAKFMYRIDDAGSVLTTMEKMEISKGGITKKELELLKSVAGLDYDTLARLLSVTRATLINKKKEEKFTGALSERIVGLADLYAYGKKVFGERERFNAWMNDPNKALGGKTPLDLIDNQFGREEVKNIIGRIEWGVYS